MSKLDRVVGGISCRAVLTGLSDYLEGELAADLRSRVEEHLRGCDRCQRFGGRVGAVVESLRRELARAPELPPEVEGRLSARLEKELSGSEAE